MVFGYIGQIKAQFFRVLNTEQRENALPKILLRILSCLYINIDTQTSFTAYKVLHGFSFHLENDNCTSQHWLKGFRMELRYKRKTTSQRAQCCESNWPRERESITQTQSSSSSGGRAERSQSRSSSSNRFDEYSMKNGTKCLSTSEKWRHHST